MTDEFVRPGNTEEDFMSLTEEQINEIANLSFKETLRLFFFGKYKK